MVQGTSPLAGSLGALDQTDPGLGRLDERSERYKAFVAEQKTLTKAADKYAQLLDKAVKATDKDTHPEAYRQLKVLQKHLELILAKVESKATTYSKEYTKTQEKLTAKIGEAQEELRQQGLDDTQINAETDYLKQQRALTGWPAITKAALAKAAAAVQGRSHS